MSVSITPHVTLDNLTYHPTAVRLGIENLPPDETLVDLIRLCQELVEPIHALLKTRVQYLSGYRCPQLHAAMVRYGMGDVHAEGRGLDFITPDIPISQAFDEIAASDLPFDTLSWYWNRFGNNWIEVTIPKVGEKPYRITRRNVREPSRVYLA